MEIVSEKIDEKILRILQRRFKHLQLPLGSLYELQQFIISLEGSYTLDNLTKIVLHEDGIYLEVDKYQIEKLVSNPIDEIEKISRGLSKTSVYGIFLTGVGLLSMYAGLSAGKYETVDFCFQPKILHSTQASEYCKSGQTVFRTSPKYLAGKDSLMPAPQFLQDDVDKFLIPAKGRRIVGKNKPTNASYLWLSGVSVLFTSAGYWLFSRTHERYQLEFPKYFGNLKTYLLNTQLESQANQEINKTLANHRANFLVDSLVGDANTRISSFGKNYQQLVAESEADEEMRKFESIRATQMDDLQFALELSNLEKMKAENLKDKAEYEMKKRKFDNDIEVKEDNESSEDNLPVVENSPEKIKEIKSNFSHAVQDSNQLLHPSEDTTWAVLNSVLSTPMSTLIVGTTGAGKTIFETAWFHEAEKKNPDIMYYGVFQKQDYPTVLDNEKYKIIIYEKKEQDKFIDLFNQFYEHYNVRRKEVRNTKNNGEKFSPIRFILGDWLSIVKSFDKETKIEILSNIADIILNGRACNCCIIADLQSFNVDALGLEADVNIRQNFNILCLGNHSTDSDGVVNSSYGVLANILKSHHVIPEKEVRESLTKIYKELQPISYKNSRPILFSSVYPLTLSLVPNLKGYGGV